MFNAQRKRQLEDSSKDPSGCLLIPLKADPDPDHGTCPASCSSDRMFEHVDTSENTSAPTKPPQSLAPRRSRYAEFKPEAQNLEILHPKANMKNNILQLPPKNHRLMYAVIGFY